MHLLKKEELEAVLTKRGYRTDIVEGWWVHPYTGRAFRPSDDSVVRSEAFHTINGKWRISNDRDLCGAYFGMAEMDNELYLLTPASNRESEIQAEEMHKKLDEDETA